jgi:hypothetical protein
VIGRIVRIHLIGAVVRRSLIGGAVRIHLIGPVVSGRLVGCTVRIQRIGALVVRAFLSLIGRHPFHSCVLL